MHLAMFGASVLIGMIHQLRSQRKRRGGLDLPNPRSAGGGLGGTARVVETSTSSRAAFDDFHAGIHWQTADRELVTTYKT
jgi:hypothetical protein